MARQRSQAQVPTVALRHRVDGGSHVDWMVERPGGVGDPDLRPAAGLRTGVRTEAREGLADVDARVLATWRMAVEPGDWEAGRTYAAERIGDHRRVYLAFQGALGVDAGGGDRGTVERIDSGVATVVRWEDAVIVLEVAMAGFAGRVEVAAEDGGGDEVAGDATRGWRSPGFRWAVRVLERRGGGGMMR